MDTEEATFFVRTEPGFDLGPRGFGVRCVNGMCYRTTLQAFDDDAADMRAALGAVLRVVSVQGADPLVAGLAKVVVVDDPDAPDPRPLGTGVLFPFRSAWTGRNHVAEWLETGLALGWLRPWDRAPVPGAALFAALDWDPADLSGLAESVGPGREVAIDLGAGHFGGAPGAEAIVRRVYGPSVDRAQSRTVPAAAFRELDAPTVPAAAFRELDAPTVPAAAFRELDAPTVPATAFRELDAPVKSPPAGKDAARPIAVPARLTGAERVGLQLRDGIVDVGRDAVDRCLWLRLASRADARGVVRADSLPGFPGDADGPTAAEVGLALAVLVGGEHAPDPDPDAPKRPAVLERVWRWLACSATPDDRNWAALRPRPCAQCGQPFRGSPPNPDFGLCAGECPADWDRCRRCTMQAVHDAGGTAGFDALTVTGLAGPVPEATIPPESVARCAVLLAHAQRDAEATATGLGLPDATTATDVALLAQALAGGLEALDGAQADRATDLLEHFGCSADVGEVVADWAVPAPEPCAVCQEPFLGRAAASFWRCRPGCRAARTVCRQCTASVVLSDPPAPCPLCRSPAVASPP